jgi:hypothetical protein
MAQAKDKKSGLVGSIAEFAGTLAGSVHAIGSKSDAPQATDEPEPVHPDVLYEDSDLNAKQVFIVGACVLGGAWIIVCLLYFYFHFLADYRAKVSPPPLPVAIHGDPQPPAPRIQASPRQDLAQFRVYEDSILNHYGWVDKQKRIVYIPIDRAMQIIAQRGIPPQKAPPDLQLFEPRAGTRLTGFEGRVEPEPR